MKTAELHGNTAEELLSKEQDLRRELFNLRFQLAKGEIQNPLRLRTVRKDIARILTVIGEKKKEGKV